MRGLLVVAALWMAVPASSQILPTEAAPPGPRTGLVVGQVVDATTGAAVPEAVVVLMLRPQSPGIPRTTLTTRVMADGDGRFFFAELPAGEHFLEATKAGFAPGTYGQRRAWGPSLRLSLAEGERLTDVTLRVWKYGVIAGTVVDEAGEPVVGVAVRALMKDVIAGRTQYGNAEVVSELVPSAITDDRGVFRLPQLSPGSYVVAVPSTQASMPAGVLEAQAPNLRSDLFFAGVTEIATPGQPRAQQIGDAALLTPAAVLTPPPPSASGKMEIYRTTYFPSASNAAGATEVTVVAGEERADITIGLRPVPAVRISGRLVTPDNSVPPSTPIRLIGEASAGVVTSDLPSGPGSVGFETVTGLSDASGRFTLLGVPPGDYLVRHGSRFIARASQQGRPSYWISQPLTVGKDDIIDLIVELRPALRVEGRIDVRSQKSGPMPPVMRNVGVVFETPFGEPGRFAVAVEDGSFATVAAGGQYLARPYEMLGWYVDSVVAGESRGGSGPPQDITDRVFDLRSDMTSIVVTYTDRALPLTGTVTDASSRASTSAMVLVFPVDPRQWTGYGASPRNIKSMPTSRTGAYTFAHLPPGDYYVVAIDAGEADGWTNPATLEALAKQATTVKLSRGDSPRTLDLRVKSIR